MSVGREQSVQLFRTLEISELGHRDRDIYQTIEIRNLFRNLIESLRCQPVDCALRGRELAALRSEARLLCAHVGDEIERAECEQAVLFQLQRGVVRGLVVVPHASLQGREEFMAVAEAEATAAAVQLSDRGNATVKVAAQDAALGALT